MKRCRRLALAGMVVSGSAAGTAAGAGAQAVVGTVTEREGGVPVAGAMVRVEDGGSAPGSRFLTGSDGRYRLLTVPEGPVVLLVERIGFADARIGPIDRAAVGATVVDIQLDTRPVDLRGLDVVAGSRHCSLDADGAREVQALWDEARKALDAALWTERESELRFVLETRVRRLDRRGDKVEAEQRQRVETRGGNSVRALSQEQLLRSGYAREEDGEVVYYGPDAATLLSDEFLRTHCFEVRPGSDEEPHLAGLGFEPAPGRDTTDIRGVMWLDTRDARLVRVAFGYTGLDAEVGQRAAGGEVGFEPLADGRWMVRDWHVRAPVRGLVRSVTSRGRSATRVMLVGIREQGTRVLAVDGPGVAWRADRPVGVVGGVVHDSLGGAPLAGASVDLADGAYRGVSDTDGGFEIVDVPPGWYAMRFRHALLDSLGLEPGNREVRVVAGGVSEVRLFVPSLDGLLPALCDGIDGQSVVGMVRDAAGTPFPGASVRVIDGIESEGEVPASITSRWGTFGLCGLPAADSLALQASVGGVVSSPRWVAPAGGGPTRGDLLIEAPGAGEEHAPGGVVGSLQGTALDIGTGRPIEGVLVRLLESPGEEVARMLTNAQGRFLLLPREPGRYEVQAEHIAYAPLRSDRLELRSRSKRVELHLASEAIPVEGLVVEVEQRFEHLEQAGYYRRKLQGFGMFLDREAIEALTPASMADLFTRVPQMNLMPDGTGSRTGRDFHFRRAAFLFGMCLPLVYVDGIIVRPGGAPEPLIDEIVPVHLVEAMELYPSASSVPVQYAGPGSGCGVVVMWTRRGPGG